MPLDPDSIVPMDQYLKWKNEGHNVSTVGGMEAEALKFDWWFLPGATKCVRGGSMTGFFYV